MDELKCLRGLKMTGRAEEIRRAIEVGARMGESDTLIGVRLGVKTGTVGWWRRRLRRMASRQESHGGTGTGAIDLIPVNVRAADTRISASQRLALGTPIGFVVDIGGVRIEVPSGFCEVELRRLIGVVRPC